jgi:malate dehydrogenase
MITIVGAGKVGSAAAFNILQDQIGDVVLVDLNTDLAKGEALDMMQAAPAIEFDGKIEGTSDFSEMEGSELVIVIAGRGRTPGMTRIDLMNTNAKILRSVVKEVARYAPECKLMVVTNPLFVFVLILLRNLMFQGKT